ncbi:hypothetical protein [Paenisporosarcina sp.]|jgi:hypothetical protein|uniref:hypothetical protein n=1 Tax=Paenisporosarcina sp. TaxID=1932001 RepID=UPI003C7101BF
MPMSYEQVVSVLDEFPELKRKEVSNNRLTYYYANSPIRKENVLQELHLSGNGYLFVGYLTEYRHHMDKRQFISIKKFTQPEFRSAVKQVLQSFHEKSKA